MEWHVYRVALRLQAPLHIGQGKISYLQRTRPYVTGRVLRGALVSRVGRLQNVQSEDPRDPYRPVSKTFAAYLTFTYFYPALKKDGDIQPVFPWDDESAFRRRFLGSYAGAALAYPQQTAAHGLLREIECILPRTRDDNQQVYLLGYIFAVDENLRKYNWKVALRYLQLGGERGTGWGRVACESIAEVPVSGGTLPLFNRKIAFDGRLIKGQKTRPYLTLVPGERTWAHVPALKAHDLRGLVEPLVGREWRANHKKRRYAGQHLAYNELCYAPGAELSRKTIFKIGEGGLWQPLEA